MDADRAALAEENAALKAELAVARAKASEDAALIVQQTLRTPSIALMPATMLCGDHGPEPVAAAKSNYKHCCQVEQ